MENEGAQLHGVVIITLPPADNPSKGKTITSFFSLTQPNPPPPPSLPLPQQHIHIHTNFRFRKFRRAFSFISISILAILLWRSLYSSQTIFEFSSAEKENEGNDEENNSFVFPIYPKWGVGEKHGNDVELKLGKVLHAGNDGVGRKKKITKIGSSSPDSSTVFSVKGNVYPYGLYYVSLLVGNPPRPYHLDMDTGSDLTWIQCDAPCTSCAKGPHPLYKPTKQSLVSSENLICKEVQSNQKYGYSDSGDQCDYEIEYEDRSSSLGVLARDEMQLMASNGTLLKPNFIFGCAYDQQGQLSVSPAKTDGIIGLSGAKISLPSQLASRGFIRNVVGHCIARGENNHGYMFLGDDFLPQWGMTWVPMLNSHSSNSYHSEIIKLAYGGEQLLLGGRGNSVGQVVFDTGSSYTYFPKEAYYDLVASLEDFLGERLVLDSSDPTLPVCWRAEIPIRSVKDVKSLFRPLTLHFRSKWWIISRKLSIPPEDYLIISEKGNVCLGILDGSKVHDGSTIILGDVSLRGQLIAYDNVNQKIGWMKSNCAAPQRYDSLPFFS